MGEAAQKIASSPVLSYEERERIVRSFIAAFLRGTVKVTIWTSKQVGRGLIDLTTGKNMELSQVGTIKSGFLEALRIVSGIGKHPQEIVRAHVDSMFGYIVAFRAGEFIEGEFLDDPQAVTRLGLLEERVHSVEKLLEDLQQIWKIKGSSSP